MKNLILIPLLFLLLGCARNSQEEIIAPEPVPDFMAQVFTNNQNCGNGDFINFNVDSKTLAVNIFEYANIDHYIDDHDTKFDRSIQIIYLNQSQFYKIFPSVLKINSSVLLDSTVCTVSSINPTFVITSSLPKGYFKNIKIGSYKLTNDVFGNTFGFSMGLGVSYKVKESNSEGGIVFEMDLSKPYVFDIECVDKSNPDSIKISGKFSGTFVAEVPLASNPNQTYTYQMSGNFSLLL